MQNRTENILNSLDGVKRAQARPFMHTRVMARLQNEDNFWSRSVSFIARPAVAFSCLALVAAADVYTVFSSPKQEQETATISATHSSTDILQTDNYILAVNNE